MRTDVVVIGAGFAGLAAARRLQANRRVLVLEARDRVGGRSCNYDLPDGTTVDIGAQWVGPTQDHILAWAKEVGVETYPTAEEGDVVLELDGRSYRGFAELPPALLEEYIAMQSRLDEMAAQVPPQRPWESALAHCCHIEWSAAFGSCAGSSSSFGTGTS